MKKNGQLKVEMWAKSYIFPGLWDSQLHFPAVPKRAEERGEQWYPQHDEAPQGAGTHQTPTEHHTAGPMLHSRIKEHLKDNHKLNRSESFSSFLTLQFTIFLLPPHFVLFFFKVQDEHPSTSSFSSWLSRSLSLLWLMQRSGQPSCVIDSKVIHDLAAEATPSVL